MSGIGLNNLIVEATRRMERKGYADVARMANATPSP